MCMCIYVYKSYIHNFYIHIYISNDPAIPLLGPYPIMYLHKFTKMFLLRFYCSIIYNRKIMEIRSREMTQRLRAFVALQKDTG